MAGLLEKSVPLATEERALVLEGSAELEKIYTTAALKGDTAPPEHEDDETLCHYICFVQSHKTGHLFLLDGDRKGPIDLGVSLKEDEDMLSGAALEPIRTFLQRENRENLNFGLLALVKGQA
jgi:ubiquitin carboxyl-terminal hydrolase L3